MKLLRLSVRFLVVPKNFVMMVFLMLSVPLIAPVFAAGPADANPSSEMTISHNQVEYIVAGKRVEVEASVSGDQVRLVRCYFKEADGGDFTYIEMSPKEGTEDVWSGVIPAPDTSAVRMLYTFMAVNEDEEVKRSPVYSVQLEDGKEVPAWQETKSGKPVTVYTELPDAEVTLPGGFDDNMVLEVADSTVRYGYKANLYSPEKIASAMNGLSKPAMSAVKTTETAASQGSSTSASASASSSTTPATSSAATTAATGGSHVLGILGVAAGVAGAGYGAYELNGALNDTSSSSGSSAGGSSSSGGGSSSGSLTWTCVADYALSTKTCNVEICKKDCGYENAYFSLNGQKFYMDDCIPSSRYHAKMQVLDLLVLDACYTIHH